MRLLPGLICLLPLLSPLAHAELIDDVNDRGELRIALEANTPPFNFKDDGKLTGFEVELGQLLANELDVRADFVVADSSDLLPGVESGKYDVAINHIAVTPELKDRFDFSEPYSYAKAQLIAQKEEAALDAAGADTGAGEAQGSCAGEPGDSVSEGKSGVSCQPGECTGADQGRWTTGGAVSRSGWRRTRASAPKP